MQHIQASSLRPAVELHATDALSQRADKRVEAEWPKRRLHRPILPKRFPTVPQYRHRPAAASKLGFLLPPVVACTGDLHASHGLNILLASALGCSLSLKIANLGHPGEGLMLIRRAIFTNLHGHINKNVAFWPGVNVLIGVNGSGKTSILNAIAWILSPGSLQNGLPAAYLLSNLQFDRIEIAFTVPGQRRHKRVIARRAERDIEIAISESTDVLRIPTRRSIERLPPRRFPRRSQWTAFEDPSTVIGRYLDDHRDNEVLQYLNSLPKPLYLPLNRQWLRESDYLATVPPGTHEQLPASAGYLPIPGVLDLAESAYLSVQASILDLNEELRQDLVASLFEPPLPSRLQTKVWALEEVKATKERILKTLDNLGITDAQTFTAEYFGRLEAVAEKLAGQTFPQDFTKHPDSDLWLEWLLDVSHLARRAEQLLHLIERYDQKYTAATKVTNSFLASVNSFVGDSGKDLAFGTTGKLLVNLPGHDPIQATDLSSGELQLLTFFTFLYFGSEGSSQQFPVIIDEPELSLHLGWQRRYLLAVHEVNPQAQFIVATHSPEIAADFQDRIINISA